MSPPPWLLGGGATLGQSAATTVGELQGNKFQFLTSSPEPTRVRTAAKIGADAHSTEVTS